jgi:hypothetical protein
MHNTGEAAMSNRTQSTSAPLLMVYDRWAKARDEWEALSVLPGNENFDSPEMRDAEVREHDAFLALIEMTPTNMAEIAAPAHVLWEHDGPASQDGRVDYLEEAAFPENRLMAAIWRGASGRDGLPQR